MAIRAEAKSSTVRPDRRTNAGQRRLRRLVDHPEGGLWLGVLLLGFVTAYFVWGGSSVNLFTYNSCLLAALGAIALNVLMGTTGQISIGNSAFLAVGAFSTVFLTRAGAPFPLDVMGGAVGAGVVGAIVGLPALRLRGLQLALATLAAFYIVSYLGNEYQSKAKNAGSGGFFLNPLFQSKGLVDGQRYWAATLFFVVSLVAVGSKRLVGSKTGRAWRMIRDHETAAPALGIEVTRAKMTVFVLSSSLIGFEGGLLAHLTGSVSTDNFTLLLAISYIAMVVVGGLDSITGAVIGAAVVTALPTWTPKVVSAFVGAQEATTKGAPVALVVYGALIVIFVVSSPGGIVGWVAGVLRRRTVRRTPAKAKNAVTVRVRDVAYETDSVE